MYNQGLSFGKVLDLLKKDSSMKFQRIGWNGKGMFIFYVAKNINIITKNHPLNRIYVEGAEIEQDAYIAMKTVQGTIVPWLASQTDMLADDWEIFKDGK